MRMNDVHGLVLDYLNKLEGKRGSKMRWDSNWMKLKEGRQLKSQRWRKVGSLDFKAGGLEHRPIQTT